MGTIQHPRIVKLLSSLSFPALAVPILQSDFFNDKLATVAIIGLGGSPMTIRNVLVILGS